jgi:3-methyladenine DNA glycosylase Tag
MFYRRLHRNIFMCWRNLVSIPHRCKQMHDISYVSATTFTTFSMLVTAALNAQYFSNVSGTVVYDFHSVYNQPTLSSSQWM